MRPFITFMSLTPFAYCFFTMINDNWLSLNFFQTHIVSFQLVQLIHSKENLRLNTIFDRSKITINLSNDEVRPKTPKTNKQTNTKSNAIMKNKKLPAFKQYSKKDYFISFTLVASVFKVSR